MRVLLGALLLCLASLPCAAQSRHYLAEETTIVAGSRDRFESGQKDYCAAVVRGGAPACLVLAPTTFSPADRYLTLLSFGTFAHYDQGTYTSKGLTPEQAKELASRRGPTIAANQESGIQLRSSTGSGPDEQRPIVLITEIHALPGKADSLVKLIRQQEMRSVRGKDSAQVEIYQTEANGDPDRLFVLQHLARFVDLDSALPLSSAAPIAQREQFNEAVARYVRSSYVTVMRYRPDLSSFAR